MRVYLFVLFSFFIGIVSCRDTSICNSDKDSLVPVTILVTAEQYRACKEDGNCAFNSPCVAFDSKEIQGSLEDESSYFAICQKMHFKMEQLEAEYPDVKRLKLKLKHTIDSFSYECESSKGKLDSIKILNLVKNLIKKLEVELQIESDKVHEPEQIPSLPTILPEEEVTAEPEHEYDHSMLVGSIRGIPGIHFPNYKEIPITSFSCSDKTIIPGFYADLETGCQVFHLCYEHRRESFLCPVGTIFNQPILACDYWYSAKCSESLPIIVTKEIKDEEITKHMEKDVLEHVLEIPPVKAKVTYIATSDKTVNPPEFIPSVTLEDTEAIENKIFDGILSLGNHVSNKLKKIPDPEYEIPVISKSHLPVKAKLATKAFASVPLVKATKISTAKVSAAVLAAGKIKAKKVATAAAVAAAVPIKAKKVATAAAVAAAVPIKAKKVAKAVAVDAAVLIKAKKVAKAVAVDAAVLTKKFPIVKGKLFKLPLAKTKLGAAAIPTLKAKKTVKVLPYIKMAALKPKIAIAPLKAKAVALPIMKVKLAKAAASPLTKKALALGYLKLLKAKKLAVMG